MRRCRFRQFEYAVIRQFEYAVSINFLRLRRIELIIPVKNSNYEISFFAYWAHRHRKR